MRLTRVNWNTWVRKPPDTMVVAVKKASWSSKVSRVTSRIAPAAAPKPSHWLNENSTMKRGKFITVRKASRQSCSEAAPLARRPR